MSKPILFQGGGEETAIPAAQPLEAAPASQLWFLVWNEGGRLMPFPAVGEMWQLVREPGARAFPHPFNSRDEALQMIALIERYIGELAIQDRLGSHAA